MNSFEDASSGLWIDGVYYPLVYAGQDDDGTEQFYTERVMVQGV